MFKKNVFIHLFQNTSFGIEDLQNDLVYERDDILYPEDISFEEYRDSETEGGFYIQFPSNFTLLFQKLLEMTIATAYPPLVTKERF